MNNKEVVDMINRRIDDVLMQLNGISKEVNKLPNRIEFEDLQDRVSAVETKLYYMVMGIIGAIITLSIDIALRFS